MKVKTLLLIGLVLIVLPLIGLADTLELENPLQAGSFSDILEAIANFIFTMALLIAPIMILVSAFYFVTSAGIEERIKKAKNILTYTIIGIVCAVLVIAFVNLISTVITG